MEVCVIAIGLRVKTFRRIWKYHLRLAEHAKLWF